jgi:hypothetical protein
MREATTRTGLAAALVIALAGTTAASAAPPKWQLFEVPLQGRANLVSVTAAGGNAAWAAGFLVADSGPGPIPAEAASSDDECSGRDSFPSLMLRWDGREWRRDPVPKVGRVNHVSASSARDVWASADCGLLHWDGRSWTAVPYAAVPAQQSGNGAIEAVGPADAWLAGGTYDTTTEVMRGFVQRWDGRQWRNVPLPDLGDHFSLDAIDARGPRDVWVAGTDLTDGDVHREHLLLLHWNGRFWKRVPEPATGEWTNRLTRVRIAAGGDVWVSGWGKRAPGGDEIRRPLLLHWNGREWTAVKVPGSRGELMDVAVSGKQALAVGDTFTPSEPDYTMYALRRTETGWQRASVPVQGMASLSGLAPIPGGGLWGVGAAGDGEHMRPVIARWR